MFRAWRVTKYNGQSGRTIAAEKPARADELYWQLYPQRTPKRTNVEDHTSRTQHVLLEQRVEGELVYDNAARCWVLIRFERNG